MQCYERKKKCYGLNYYFSKDINNLLSEGIKCIKEITEWLKYMKKYLTRFDTLRGTETQKSRTNHTFFFMLENILKFSDLREKKPHAIPIFLLVVIIYLHRTLYER